ncbi:hypothetical protein I4U23_015237 [Adineta vaga]|nr:hypothetical protein I4U23_015237 [Adineta vaga]
MNANQTDIVVDQTSEFLYHTKFLLLITFYAPAMILSFLIFTFFITNRAELINFQNHSLFILFIINFLQLSTNMPMSIHFYYFHSVHPATVEYCTWWTFTLFSFSVISEFLMATISIQRHLFVFRLHLFQHHIKRYIFYYLPLILCITYPLIFYIFSIFFITCDGTQWDFTLPVCGFSNCYFLYDRLLTLFDYIVNNSVPIIVIFLANISLIMRVIRQKRRFNRPMTWKNHRRLTLQLVCVSSLYLIAWTPLIINTLILNVSPTDLLIKFQMDYISEFPYLICFLFPWMYACLLPEFSKWIRKNMHHRRLVTNTVHPI